MLYDECFLFLIFGLFFFAGIKYYFRKSNLFNIILCLEFIVVASIACVAAWYISKRPGDIEGDTAVYIWGGCRS